MAEFDKQEPIAIIGAACRLPGEVTSLGSLWDMISNARTGHGKIPSDRWDADVLHHPDQDRKGSMAVKHGYFLNQDVSHFDAPFFSTTAKEAASMDPVKRLLLEVSYESIENAGIPVESLMNSQTGCYVGCMTDDYELLSLHDIYDLGHTAASAISEAMTANRVSWFFGLQGPSLTLDTACSSSLYALHLACQSLKLKETNMGLVAGVNLILNPNTMHQLSAMHMLSPEGISHTFDDRANGYGRGEGIGCLVVKRLSDALRDGDTIRAVIRHTGANADGKTPSITQPSSAAQADLVRRTYDAAGLSLNSTQYFESHGTGTPVGDPIELEAIATTLGAARTADGLGPLYVGSIKPNVGHTEGCSGLAGVFKALVCLEKGMLVPTYGVDRVNRKLKFTDWNLALPPHTMKWPARGQRRISINSFGFGGANAHAILDDAHHYLKMRGLVGNHTTTVHDNDLVDDEGSESGISMGPATPLSQDVESQTSKQLFVFSTKDQAGIKRLASLYGQELEKSSKDKHDAHYLSNLAYTLAVRRSHHDFRSFAVASSLAELNQQLLSKSGLPKMKRSSRLDNNLVFVFTGQGAQWPAMGRQLLGNHVFRGSMTDSQLQLKALGCDWNVFEELQKTSDSNIALPEFSQTLCTVLQVALVDLLKHWNVMPKATVGHSSGEIAAAYAASYISHADAIKIAYVRGLSSASVTREGAMMAAGISRTEAQQYLAQVPHESAVVACVNSPSSVTLSGDVDAIDTLEKLISADGKFARKLRVKTAYHSPHMRSVAQGYLERIGHVETLPGGDTLMFSSLTGKLVSPAELNAQYWVSNMCAAVEFSAALSSLLSHTAQPTSGRRKTAPIRWGGFVEIGPHSALQGPVQQNIAAGSSKAAKDAPYVSMLLRNKDANETALTAVGQLWSLGVGADLSTIVGSSIFHPKALTDLPPYPWNHARGFWHEAYSTRSNRFPLAPRTDLLGVPEDLQNSLEPRWKNHLRISENPWIEDHKITGTILYPAAGMLIMALEGALQTVDSARKVRGFRFGHVGFERGLVVTSGDDAAVETRLSLLPHKTLPGHFQFTIFSTTTGTAWTKHCSGTIALEYATGESEVENSAVDPAWAQQSDVYKSLTTGNAATEDVPVDTFYDHLESIGMEYGPLFRNVISLTAVPSQKASYGAVAIPDTKSSMPANFEYPHVMHPATMDAIFHLLLAAVNDGKPVDEAAVPYSIEDMYVAAEQPQGAGSLFHGYGNLATTSNDGHEIVGNLIVSDQAWSAPRLVVKGFALRQVTSTSDTGAANASDQSDTLKKCARIEWSEDVDFIRTSEDVFRFQGAKQDNANYLSLWLDRLVHKQAVGEVLVVLDDGSSHTQEILDDVWARVGRRPGLKKASAVATSTAGLELLRSSGLNAKSDFQLWDATSDEQPPFAEAEYQVVLVIGSHTVEHKTESLAKLQKVLLPQGHLVVVPAEGSQADTIKTSLEILSFTKTVAVSGSPDLVIATNAPSAAAETTTAPAEVHLLHPSSASAEVLSLSSALTAILSSSNISVYSHSLTPNVALELAGKHIISLLEVDTPFIYSWSEVEFAAFKTLVSSASHLLWLTRGSVLESWAAGVEFAPAQGLLRVMRNEYSLATLPHLDLSAAFRPASRASAELVIDVWRASLAESAEMEYAELDGAIYIPRAVEDGGFDEELQLAEGIAKPVRSAVHGSGKALKLGSAVSGGDLVWVEDEDAALPLQPDQVEVQVEFVALPSGASDEKTAIPHLAREAVGVVSRYGDNVKSFTSGQRVVVFGAEACKTHLRQNQILVAALPSGILPEEAAALPSAFVAAQHVLVEVAHLSHGQTVLVHDAASALGQASIQVSQSAGADVFALVASKEEKTALIERYGISPARIFDSNLQYFVAAIQQATSGSGVDVVLSSRPGPAILPSVAVLGEFGYFLDLGASTPDSPEINLTSSKRNASLIRIDMDRVQQAKPQAAETLFQRTFSGPIAPIFPTTVFSVSNTVQAVEALTTQQHGKVVLAIDADATVLTFPPPAPRLVLDKDATYVLAGGLGALGLDIADMMIEHGTKNLVFLSRSGGSRNETDLEGFRSRGVVAEAFKCDVNDIQSVTRVFDQLRNEGHLVKGLIQCAMVLEDTIFDNMTHEKWWRAFQPKTRGSRNLLAQLSPADAPFFILLSSITGIIGNTAQANYASGNTFEDALAHHAREHLGIAATSIDVGLVSDSSHFTEAGEFGDLESYLHKYQHGWSGLQCSLEELRATLQAVMRRSTADGQDIPAQMVLGLGDGLVREDGASGFERDRKFDLRVVTPRSSAGEGAGKGVVSVGEKLSQATTLGEAAAAVEESLKGQIAAAIGVEIDEVDGQKPLPEFGVDSLKAVEMRNRTLREMQSDISVFELLSATPLSDLAAKIASRSGLVKLDAEKADN